MTDKTRIQAQRINIEHLTDLIREYREREDEAEELLEPWDRLAGNIAGAPVPQTHDLLGKVKSREDRDRHD